MRFPKFLKRPNLFSRGPIYDRIGLEKGHKIANIGTTLSRFSVFKKFFYEILFWTALMTSAWFLWIIFPSYFSETTAYKPIARTRNGTYFGFHDRKWDQDFFLGMPYAEPPLEKLRFRRPQSLNQSWNGLRDASEYGPMCITYWNADKANSYPQSEDCLSINVIRPSLAGTSNTKLLPVAVFIYGGAGAGSGARHQSYNMSFIVSHATMHDMPFIAVSFNYRSTIWGFLTSRETQGTGNLNVGLHDQRLALQWVQENIHAFNGDPTQVTLWGGSSGADDVGLHLLAYGGRDDRLFRAAILQSGSAVTRLGFRHFSSQPSFDRLVNSTSCEGVEDSLNCLRFLPHQEVSAGFMNAVDESLDILSHSLPVIDGDLIQSYSSLSLKNSKFVKVPLIIGVTSNEGYDWISPSFSRWEHMIDDLQGFFRQYPTTVVDRLLSYYPAASRSQPLDPPIKGIEDLDTYNRMETVYGDLERNAAKRLMCDSFSKFTACYSYRFDAVATLKSKNPHEGVAHSAEIVPVFQNFEGVGFSQEKNPMLGKGKGYIDMSKAIGLMWAGLITHLDPNYAFENETWPRSSTRSPQNIVFNETGPYWIEDDNNRRVATDYINSIQHSVLDK
ncbi:putative Carboxylic ester hydrolase [Seiridium cardinale]|uniref:Carboxylic ester hydrolase n=1 Tax=Seiridium cardinale TaxID=138064 RepID=A0ABR2XF92_9PEZI